MAYNRAFFILFLLFFVFHITDSAPVPQGISAYGNLYCSSTGNYPGNGVAQMDIKLNCYKYEEFTTVGNNPTDSKGFFNITISDIEDIDLNTQCYVYFDVPTSTGNCAAFTTAGNGHIWSFLKTVGYAQTAKYGLVQKETVDKWQFISN